MWRRLFLIGTQYFLCYFDKNVFANEEGTVQIHSRRRFNYLTIVPLFACHSGGYLFISWTDPFFTRPWGRCSRQLRTPAAGRAYLPTYLFLLNPTRGRYRPTVQRTTRVIDSSYQGWGPFPSAARDRVSPRYGSVNFPGLSVHHLEIALLPLAG